MLEIRKLHPKVVQFIQFPHVLFETGVILAGFCATFGLIKNLNGIDILGWHLVLFCQGVLKGCQRDNIMLYLLHTLLESRALP